MCGLWLQKKTAKTLRNTKILSEGNKRQTAFELAILVDLRVRAPVRSHCKFRLGSFAKVCSSVL
ncbi:MAG TPA: hypothetical protein DCL66_05550 [Gammaproteobacteria bacterium]|nr:hypothetical protein [Gammaproteobacteria bacterium]